MAVTRRRRRQRRRRRYTFELMFFAKLMMITNDRLARRWAYLNGFGRRQTRPFYVRARAAPARVFVRFYGHLNTCHAGRRFYGRPAELG
jgi:hypothetical protein